MYKLTEAEEKLMRSDPQSFHYWAFQDYKQAYNKRLISSMDYEKIKLAVAPVEKLPLDDSVDREELELYMSWNPLNPHRLKKLPRLNASKFQEMVRQRWEKLERATDHLTLEALEASPEKPKVDGVCLVRSDAVQKYAARAVEAVKGVDQSNIQVDSKWTARLDEIRKLRNGGHLIEGTLLELQALQEKWSAMHTSIVQADKQVEIANRQYLSESHCNCGTARKGHRIRDQEQQQVPDLFVSHFGMQEAQAGNVQMKGQALDTFISLFGLQDSGADEPPAQEPAPEVFVPLSCAEEVGKSKSSLTEELTNSQATTMELKAKVEDPEAENRAHGDEVGTI